MQQFAQSLSVHFLQASRSETRDATKQIYSWTPTLLSSKHKVEIIFIMSNSAVENVVSFRINGRRFTVSPGQSENTRLSSVLVDYIRHEAGLTGTKYMCREGGCGACVVSAIVKDPVSGEKKTVSVNSCLVPVFSCDGWDISTIESLGNHREGYDVIQNRMVGFSGTQCGYCTPGMIMNMHALREANPELTAKEIEDSLDGNICRCTGFRPILDAFKSLAVDVPDSIKRKCAEIEEVTGKVCPMKGACCSAGRCLKNETPSDPEIEECYNKKITSHIEMKTETGQKWIKPTTLAEALELLGGFVAKKSTYRVVAGNTSTGIFKNQEPFTAYVDVKGIPELHQHDVLANKAVLGAGATLAFAISFLKKISKISGFEYGTEIAKHLGRVANTAVRNIATVAGNLMIKHAHNEFPSDVFTTLEGLGAKVYIASSAGQMKSVSLLDFLKLDMNGCLIISIELPALPKADGYVARRFKITKRHQNAHAYVNAAFTFKLDSAFVVKEKPLICLGGISPTFVHATATETFLTGKALTDPKVVQQALEIMEQEVVPAPQPPDASPEYRKTLARNLLYKTILGFLGSKATPKLGSGGSDIEYKVFSSKQTYDTHKDQWPLTQPIPKIEAAQQCSGETEFTNDIPKYPHELFGVFVLSKMANCELKNIDASQALKVPGVVALITAKDIPGRNNFQAVPIHPIQADEEVFASKKVHYFGQAVGMILAETRDAAVEAAKLAKVSYENVQKPVLGFEEAIAIAKKSGSYDKLFFFHPKSGQDPPKDIKHKLSGEISFPSQVHLAMEPHVTLCVPKEGGLDVFSATQFVDQVQAGIAELIGVPNNTINVRVRRLGGGFGSKGTPASHVACAAGLGAYLTNRPVRVVCDIDTNFHMMGKRVPYLFNYEVGFDDDGNIQCLKATILGDNGAISNEGDLVIFLAFLQNAYRGNGWSLDGGSVNTNTTPNTYCRAPGSMFGIAAIESIMEHIAHYLKKDPLEVRMNNLIKSGDEIIGIPGISPSYPFQGENVISKLVDEMKANADYLQRKAQVAAFNKVNRWKKRGLSIVPMRYPQHFFFTWYPSYVAVYHVDGTVAISTGGIDMGQGLNTKAAQVAAYTLGIPLDKIQVKPVDNFVSPNSIVSAAGQPSEIVSWATTQACKILLEKLAPFREKLGEDAKWEDIIAAAHAAGVDLRAHYMPKQNEPELKPYNIWGLTLTEIEVDILTGEYKGSLICPQHLHLIEDAGKSMSPEVDIGQVEGSLVFGLGVWTTEKLQHDKTTGELLTHNTWEYKTPLAKNTPEDFRVTLMTNTVNPVGIHGSKSVGEPAVCMAVGVVFALKNAIDSARQDAGNFEHYQLETPLTPENVLKCTLTSKEHLQL